MPQDVQHQLAIVTEWQLENIATFGVETALLIRVPHFRSDPSRALDRKAQPGALRLAAAYDAVALEKIGIQRLQRYLLRRSIKDFDPPNAIDREAAQIVAQ